MVSALVTMRITVGANAWRSWEINVYHVNVKEMCSARVRPECTREDGTNRETTGEGADLRTKQPGKKNHGS